MTAATETRRPSAELAVCLAVAALLVAARGALFLVPGVRFDADQGIVGLMAKHISEGRAFPVFFYGQSYLPALEAYLAAPLMWVLGPSEASLKLPVVAMNVAASVLLVLAAIRDGGLRPALALAATLSVLVPAFVPGTRFMEAMGGNVEPLLTTMLLWHVRDRRWTFGAILAVSVVVREIALFPVAALLLLEAWHRGWREPAVRERWAIALLLTVMASATIEALRPHAAMFGPGSIARPAELDITGGQAVAGQICLDPSRWATRGALLVNDHLPYMFGGRPGSALPIGVNTGINHGNVGLRVWLPLLLTAALVAILVGRPTAPGPSDTPGEGRVPPGAFPWYLVLTGLASLGAYWLVACTQISLNSLRYDLLVTLVPVGVLIAALDRAHRLVRAGLVTATVMWCAIGARDFVALADETWRGAWPDRRGDVAAALEARGIDVLWGEFRMAYVISFRSAERVVVAPTTVHRIDEYARRAAAARAPMLRTTPCDGGAGEEIVPTIWLCPTPGPEELPPVY